MNSVILESKAKQNLPAKQISNNFSEIKKIILRRIERDFYSSEFVEKKVLEKLIETILKPTES